MITNEDGLKLIKSFEGWRSRPYKDSTGIPTIGWGSTYDVHGYPVTMEHRPIDQDHGTVLQRQGLSHARWAISKLITVPLSQDQFSALVSFTYNVGSGNLQRSTLRMALNRYDYYDAANEFPKWRRAGGIILKGLVRRRAAERALFLRGTDYALTVIPYVIWSGGRESNPADT